MSLTFFTVSLEYKNKLISQNLHLACIFSDLEQALSVAEQLSWTKQLNLQQNPKQPVKQ